MIRGLKEMFIIPVNAALFEWVIENISKNAIDAMEGNGEISYRIIDSEKNVIIDISDTGKGIPRNHLRRSLIRVIRPSKEDGALDFLWLKGLSRNFIMAVFMSGILKSEKDHASG